MAAPKRVLCIMDIATVGRASLSVTLPVLSACGVQCCPLPAALFSTHTGFEGPVRRDEAAFCEAALAHFKKEKLQFDAILVGYLCSEGQLGMAQSFFDAYPAAKRFVDPAFADGGKLYAGLTATLAAGMGKLAEGAFLLTPNCTESGVLLGEAPDAKPSRQQLDQRLKKLARRSASVLITGVQDGADGLLVLGREGQEVFEHRSHKLGQSYPGTGDIFTAVVAGCVLRGKKLADAVSIAADFVAMSIAATLEGGGEARHGLWFEGQLGALAHAVNADG